jgi:hypothetical protein
METRVFSFLTTILSYSACPYIFYAFYDAFQREPSTRLPQLLQSNNDSIDEQVRQNDEKSKSQAKPFKIARIWLNEKISKFVTKCFSNKNDSTIRSRSLHCYKEISFYDNRGEKWAICYEKYVMCEKVSK